MTSSEIRASFLDFFKEKQHTIVPSSSLLPDAPNLLFTNAGMNQFVPIFLGQAPCPYRPPRAADTQKCIRAGGKHNDLEDVGFDTYHHTFFEMLGNWSFGDYFKKEAIAWAWELVVGRWNFPASRLYATVYQPGQGDPSSFDQEAHDLWADIFTKAGLDPAVHIVYGNKKDNFWMMGDTGPCGPNSELHVNLTPGPRDLDPAAQKEGRKLVNSSDARCIEIWNLVFIQFNANPDGTFVELPAKHVDTGMGFERVVSMIQGTKGLTDFSENAKISNYETDVFRPLFDELEKLTGKKYESTLPTSAQNETEQEKIDVAFRVIADHIRTLSFSIADGIQPSNEGRGYVLRRILRRAVRYGRNLGLREPFLGKLVAVLGATMGHIFPEVVAKADLIRKTLTQEEESFLRTLDRGIELFESFIAALSLYSHLLNGIDTRTLALRNSLGNLLLEDSPGIRSQVSEEVDRITQIGMELSQRRFDNLPDYFYIARGSAAFIQETYSVLTDKHFEHDAYSVEVITQVIEKTIMLDSAADQIRSYSQKRQIPGEVAFTLYDTYGFPVDLTELMARERDLSVDVAEFERLMEKQKDRSRASQKKDAVIVALQELMDQECTDQDISLRKQETEVNSVSYENESHMFIVPKKTPFYVEMGGQVGDEGEIVFKKGNERFPVTKVIRRKGAIYHLIEHTTPLPEPLARAVITLHVAESRRSKIEAHHSGTHLLNWALRKVLGNTVSQKGSYVGPDRLRFDFSHGGALTPEELAEVEKLVNEKIEKDLAVAWDERPYTQVKGDPSILQFFGDKYGETVRVVSIGDFSKELCGGTHVKHTAQIGYFKILHEAAIAAGIRRIEAASGDALRAHLEELLRKQDEQFAHAKVAGAGPAPVGSTEEGTGVFSSSPAPATLSLPDLWQRYKDREKLLHDLAAQRIQHEKDAAKQQEALFQKRAAETAPDLIGAAADINGIPVLAVEIEGAPAAYLPVLADALKTRWQGVAVFATVDQGKVALLCAVAPAHTKRVQAGKIIQAIAPLVGGKGGGRPELAQGGGTNPEGVAAALAKAEELVRAI